MNFFTRFTAISINKKYCQLVKIQNLNTNRQRPTGLLARSYLENNTSKEKNHFMGKQHPLIRRWKSPTGWLSQCVKEVKVCTNHSVVPGTTEISSNHLCTSWEKKKWHQELQIILLVITFVSQFVSASKASPIPTKVPELRVFFLENFLLFYHPYL